MYMLLLWEGEQNNLVTECIPGFWKQIVWKPWSLTSSSIRELPCLFLEWLQKNNFMRRGREVKEKSICYHSIIPVFFRLNRRNRKHKTVPNATVKSIISGPTDCETASLTQRDSQNSQSPPTGILFPASLHLMFDAWISCLTFIQTLLDFPPRSVLLRFVSPGITTSCNI